MSCSGAQTQTIQAILASEGCGLADLAPTLRQKESDSQTETRGEEEDWMRGEKKSQTEKNGMKMRSDKVTDGSPDSEHNHVSLQRFKSQRSIRYSSSTKIQLFSNSRVPHSH